MATSSRHRAPARPARRKAADATEKECRSQRRYRRDQLAAAAGGALLTVAIGVLSVVAHHSLSAARPAPARPAPALPASTAGPLTSSVPLPAWLDEAQPSITAMVTARDNIVAAAARRDIADTAAACRTAAGAVADIQRHLPSPDPDLTTALQHALVNYQTGIGYCISGTQNHDAANIQQATAYINTGNTDLQTAFSILDGYLASNARDTRVLMV